MISYRRITMDDYADICDISKDIWGGNDYLPFIFEKWVKAEGYFLGAIDTEKNKVIGVGKYSILHDKSGWMEGLRVHKEYRGLKLGRHITEELIKIARKELEAGNIKRIGLGTHVSNIESVSLIKKLNFKPKQEHLIIEGPENQDLDINFEVKSWDLSFEEFSNLRYFKDRDNIIPLAFVFEEPTYELYNEFKENNCFISINGFKGIFKIKGEAHFIAVDDNFDSLDTFMKYAQKISKEKQLASPFTSIRKDDKALIEVLKEKNYIAWYNWEPDYFYFVLEL